MKTRLFKICLVVFCMCIATAPRAFAQTATAASAQPNSDVEVRLSLAGEKSVYRAGEPVRLVLSFKSSASGYRLNTTATKPASPIDDVIISTDAGVTHWLDEYSAGYRYSPDYMALEELSSSPKRVALVLNDWVRFDRPGRYAVRVKTARVMRSNGPHEVGPLPPLTTNEVAFEIVAMSAAEEESEVKRLSALLDAATKDWKEEARVSEELSYLTGEPSTREKVRRYLTPTGVSGNVAQNLSLGLAMARDRALTVRLFEAALRDTQRPATQQLLGMLTGLRLLLESPPHDAPTWTPTPATMMEASGEKLRADERVRQEYVRELAASLPRRAGESRRTTAMTVLLNLPKEPGQAAQIVGGVREILLREFDSLSPYDREYLLRYQWESLRDSSLVPALERMLAGAHASGDFQVRTAALMRLMEFDKQRARPFVVAELRDVSSFADLDVLSSLDEETLSDADEALLPQIRTLAAPGPNADFVRLRQRSLLAARFASPAIYDGLMEVYEKWGSKWQVDARGAMLGYFARYNEAQAAPLIEQALAETPSGQDQSFLTDLTRANYNGAIDAILRARLEGAEPQAAGTAAYVMSLHGPESDRALIESRLARWRKEWSGRAAELDAEGADGALVTQRMVEVNLVGALLSGNRWKLTEEESDRLKRSCMTKQCRQYYPAK
jgi:hypothetical protein